MIRVWSLKGGRFKGDEVFLSTKSVYEALRDEKRKGFDVGLITVKQAVLSTECQFPGDMVLGYKAGKESNNLWALADE